MTSSNAGVNASVPQFPATKQYRSNKNLNKLSMEDKSAHDWYRFVLSYPPHLVRDYLEKFHLNNSHKVLDPFCGTGTTNVECKKLGIASVGIEANPFAHFAAKVKVDWSVNPESLIQHSSQIAKEALRQLDQDGVADDLHLVGRQQHAQISTSKMRVLDVEVEKLLLTNSISPRPLHKVLILLEKLNQHQHSEHYNHQMLAFAKVLTFSISNLSFGPEVGIGQIKDDTPVIAVWLEEIYQIASDLRMLQTQQQVFATIYHADARNSLQNIEPNSIDAVITSPPYPNEKDYTRTTRLETVMLGFATSKAELQTLKRGLLRSNTRGVYKNDDDDKWVENFPKIQAVAEAIEERRIALGKTSGFERLYARVTKLYFGGMARHLAELRMLLRPEAQLAYVVGDQASYLRIMIRTGQHLADIAQSLGYEVVGIDLFRTRISTATKEQLREEVVLLRWPGNSKIQPFPAKWNDQ